MQSAAIFGAEDVEAAGLCRLEPQSAIAIRQHVGLGAEVREKEAVNDVFRGHRDADGTANRHMQRVDLALSARMLKLPHPLLAGGIDVEGVVGNARELEVEPRSPNEGGHEKNERDDDPGQLQTFRGLLLLGEL